MRKLNAVGEGIANFLRYTDKNYTKIAREFGVSIPTVRSVAIHLGLHIPNKHRSHARHRDGKTLHIARYFWKNQHLTYREIGDKFGVSRQCVEQAVHSLRPHEQAELEGRA